MEGPAQARLATDGTLLQVKSTLLHIYGIVITPSTWPAGHTHTNGTHLQRQGRQDTHTNGTHLR